MKLYLKGRKGQVDAVAEYQCDSSELIVLKGSKISSTVAGGKFRSSRSVEKQRNEDSVRDNLVVKDIHFKSPSSAANFVNGSSTNGLIAWKTEDGKTLKTYLAELEEKRG